MKLKISHKHLELFWSRVTKTSTCWLYTGPKGGKNYATFRPYGSVHKLSFRLHKGEIPSGMLVCHKCDNPQCVRPSHLFLGTHKRNTEDMVSKGRHGSRTHPERWPRGNTHPLHRDKNLAARGVQNGNARLTELQVIAIKKMMTARSLTQHRIAEKFGVSKSTVIRIRNGVFWKELTT